MRERNPLRRLALSACVALIFATNACLAAEDVDRAEQPLLGADDDEQWAPLHPDVRAARERMRVRPGVDEPVAEPVRLAGKLVAVDRFRGRLGLNWKPVRHVPTHASLTKNPGLLTITTQRGSIHGDEKNDRAGEGIQAKNLFLIDNPLADEVDFVITLAVKRFEPQIHYHQVGLLCYDDDDNYLKWGYEHSWQTPDTQNFVLVRETIQRPQHDLVVRKSGLNRFWLRIAKTGLTYQCAFSTDGREFEVVGEKPWGDGSPQRLGFLAKNGGNPEAGEIDVCISAFKLRGL